MGFTNDVSSEVVICALGQASKELRNIARSTDEAVLDIRKSTKTDQQIYDDITAIRQIASGMIGISTGERLKIFRELAQVLNSQIPSELESQSIEETEVYSARIAPLHLTSELTLSNFWGSLRIFREIPNFPIPEGVGLIRALYDRPGLSLVSDWATFDYSFLRKVAPDYALAGDVDDQNQAERLDNDDQITEVSGLTRFNLTFRFTRGENNEFLVSTRSNELILSGVSVKLEFVKFEIVT